MRVLRAAFSRVRGLFGTQRADDELSAELTSHFELHIAELMRGGMTEENARREAVLKFGGIERAKEDYRDQRGVPAVESLLQDLRYAVRTLRKDPGFTAIAVGMLALGIGANTAIFSVVHAVMLEPPRFGDPGRLYVVHEIISRFRDKYPLLPVNAGHFTTWQKQWSAIDAAAAIEYKTDDLTGAGEPERVGGARVSANTFRMLGVTPVIGRTFDAGDETPGRNPVAVLTHSIWQRRFGMQTSVLGKTIHLDGRPHTIIGILPAGITFPSSSELNPIRRAFPKPEIFRPLAFSPGQLLSPGNFDYQVIVRLKPGRDARQALEELNVLQKSIGKAGRIPVDLEASITPLKSFGIRDVWRGLVLLMAAVGGILLIVCVNLANLLLARSMKRRRELAIRTALGAGRGRILRQLFTESLLLSAAGGIAGVLIAIWGTGMLIHQAPVDLPRAENIGLNTSVLLFALSASAGTGLLFGLVPALQLSGIRPIAALKAGAQTISEGRASKLALRALVSSEMALCTALVIVSGLLLGSFSSLINVHKGFEVTGTTVMDLLLPQSRYPKPQQRNEFFRKLLESIETLPRVASAGMVTVLPLRGAESLNLVSRPGDIRPVFERPMALYAFVSPGYFGTLRIPVRQGRTFREADRKRKFAIVSEHTAQRLWPGDNPVGKTFHQGDTDDDLLQIVGVVADVRTVSLREEPGMMVYVPYWQQGSAAGSIAVRTTAGGESLAAALRAKVRELDSELPVSEIHSLQTVVVDSVAANRFQVSVVSLFAAVGLLLASLGIFGVVSRSVAQRTGEIGIRMALGARPSDVRRMIVREALAPVLPGLVAGVAIAIAAAHALRSLLFGVGPADPLILVASVALLLGVALVACWAPALRATSVDPASVLRCD